ncbi:class I SAM-dependent methyltransferase [Vibrio parahaemolyticus]|uniref:class I SAM-dependent methyltransferase n=2 Tax=Vibrio parahaemolyticus TaxID=670 RepID=UPI0002A5AED6|nr:class I SAM-dependent methyltransferase [Vibrio parahaemolyticus]OMC62073.1 SAM-dependent methyltransferase [Vibrio parahaemolyticus CFSAN001595]AGB09773.1 hypothetical protein VPBB_1286 [Vibrio parahaemolyticus BB22OP]EGR0435913.1 class I SAM-dependent methyltransferase [Vibrio parahaemolyticus]EGR0440083.1 class I SAM-dependent methyltransferase [Vibrio parahaemolyticus]EGR0766319.1 class I SAM-dependent methyltransferase [Vibrio parahaemolyticus]
MNMKANYHVHEDMYVQARKEGWEGWGGNERISQAILVQRFIELEGAPTFGKLLEVGCGEGHHCRAFFKLGFEVTGIDISPTAISWAKEKARDTGNQGAFYVADLTEKTLEIPEIYDVVIDGNCLHCIIGEDRNTFLGHIYNSLVENGVFFVSSLCAKDRNSYEITKNDHVYRHVCSQQSLITELEQSGFRVVTAYVYEREEINHITIHAVKVVYS